MIVYSRRPDESIVIPYDGEEITITVVNIQGDKVRLGITAPRSIPVHRGEVFEVLSRRWASPDLTTTPGSDAKIELSPRRQQWLEEIARRCQWNGSPTELLERILDVVASLDLDWEEIHDLDRLTAALRNGNARQPPL